jgi:hypothetical protein
MQHFEAFWRKLSRLTSVGMRVKFRIAAHATPPGTGGQQTLYQDQKTRLLDKRRAYFAAT